MANSVCIMVVVGVSMQLTTEVMQLYSDDDEVEKAFSGENVKIKLKNVEEEVNNEHWHLICIVMISYSLFCVLYCC